jgi:hypothetical protein
MSSDNSLWVWNSSTELWCLLSPAGEYWTDSNGKCELTSQEMEEKNWPEVKFVAFNNKREWKIPNA